MIRFAVCAIATVVIAAGLTGCEGERPVEVFVPPQGDAVKGRQVFVDYECTSCHSIPNVDLPGAAPLDEAVMPLAVRLHRVTDYGDLLTAVIYPDHAVSPKYLAAQNTSDGSGETIAMPDFTERMSVAELIDVVEFLHVQYGILLGSQYHGKGAPPRGRLDRRVIDD